MPTSGSEKIRGRRSISDPEIHISRKKRKRDLVNSEDK
jgi:hypothetical protein